jgi:hypothetical protein
MYVLVFTRNDKGILKSIYMAQKICSQCNEQKDIDCFKKDNNRPNHRNKCKECWRKYSRAWRYGMDMEHLEFLESKSHCAICENKITEQSNIDHNHLTGQIRDILCSCCNAALGLVREDISVLSKMITYIKKWEDKN